GAVAMTLDFDDLADAQIRLRARLAVDGERSAAGLEAHAVDEHAAESRNRPARNDRDSLRRGLRCVVARRTAAAAAGGQAERRHCGEQRLDQMLSRHLVDSR